MGTRLDRRVELTGRLIDGDLKTTPCDPLRVPLATGRRRVLLVDNNAEGSGLFAQRLRELGCEVALTRDPRTALELLERLRPQIAILGIRLWGMNGHQLAARMRQMPAAAGCLLIALSGYEQDSPQARGQRTDLDHYLVKPAGAEPLLKWIADGLGLQPDEPK